MQEYVTVTGYDRCQQVMTSVWQAMIGYVNLWHVYNWQWFIMTSYDMVMTGYDMFMTGYDMFMTGYDRIWQAANRLASPITLFLCSSYFIKYIFKFSIVMTLNFAKSFYEYIKLSQSYMLVHVSTAAQCINVCT